ncbi:MAG TPA: aspartyl protease family protein [Blastocatellia bacterium]|nr:aspartyl protease family protein [Blastocatellia bacterium]
MRLTADRRSPHAQRMLAPFMGTVIGIFILGAVWSAQAQFTRELGPLDRWGQETPNPPPQAVSGQPTGRRYRKALGFMRQGDYEKAAAAFGELIEKNPDDHPARLGRCYAFIKQGKLNDALPEILSVIQKEPYNARAYALLGIVLLRSGVFSQSARAFETALTLNEKEPLALAGLAELDFFENRSDLSYQRLRRATALDPNEPDFWIALGRAAARLEKFREAAEHYERFLAVSPKLDHERRERYRGLIEFYRALSTLGITHLHRIEGPRVVRIPLRLQNDRPFIQARVGEGNVLNLVIDTGASISVLSQDAVEKLGIRPLARGGRARAVGGSGSFPIVYGLLDSLTLGELKIYNVPIYIRPFHHLPTRESNSETVLADGFLGLSVLSNFRVTLEYGTQQLILENDPPPVAASVNPLPDQTSEIPFRTTNGGLVSAEVRLHNGEVVNFLVDTGASATVLGSHIVKKYGFEKYILQSPKIRVLGAAGVIENVDLILVPSLSMDGLIQKNIRAPVLDLEAVNESAGFMQAGILGGSFLKHFRVVFDFARARLMLTRLGQEGEKTSSALYDD